MARVILEPIGGPRAGFLPAEEFEKNRATMAAAATPIREGREVVRDGWGEAYRERLAKKEKLPTWERIERLRDPGSDIFPIGTFVNYGIEFEGGKRSPGAGVVTAFVRIGERYVVVIANDNTVASGAWWPLTPEKIERAQEIARRLRLPVVYLVDCSGLFLPEQGRSFPGPTGAGHIFKMNSLLSAQQVPQIAGVFGDCIAGGGYMPIISDRVYMTEQAYMVIAGAALVKGAKSQHITSLSIGGPDVHVHLSNCADFRGPDDETILAMIRRDVCSLPTSAADYYRYGATAADPHFPATELDGLFPADHRMGYDVRQVIARLTDDSLFREVLADRGQEMITGVGKVGGLWAGFIANNQSLTAHPDRSGRQRPGGILYRDGIAKISLFSRCLNDDGVPIVWLQDISGFDIGPEAEKEGLLGYGSSLIYTNSTNETPMITVLLRKASGAGYYAMAGAPYDPVLQLSTPITRLAVMEGRTLAIGAYRTKLDDEFEVLADDETERQAVVEGMAKVEARITSDMDPIRSARQMDTDEIVTMSELRPWLTAIVEMCYQSTGYRRVKNPRIWSLHDIEALTGR
jgi:acetyl-CoA carboxylase carboxyltransferase component